MTFGDSPFSGDSSWQAAVDGETNGVASKELTFHLARLKKRQWEEETMGGRDNGRKRQWEEETMGGRDNGRKRQWEEETMGGRDNGVASKGRKRQWGRI